VRSALDSGVDVIAFDLRHEALDRAESLGARRVESLADLARRADVVSVIVVDDDDVRAVVGGRDGLLAGMAPGGTIIAVIREAMHLAAGFGIDEAEARQILLRSTAEAWMLHNWDHLQAFYTDHRLAADREELIDLLVKDIWSAVLAGRSRRVYLPVTAMIAQTLPAMHAAAFDAANAPAVD
jgi:3-hydroxyisobutyrate dehydrogenase-like beta-hydroxyacid dehydrogenase